jgi:hypothetical protein
MFVSSCYDFDFVFVLRFERTNGNPGMEKSLEVSAQVFACMIQPRLDRFGGAVQQAANLDLGKLIVGEQAH